MAAEGVEGSPSFALPRAFDFIAAEASSGDASVHVRFESCGLEACLRAVSIRDGSGAEPPPWMYELTNWASSPSSSSTQFPEGKSISRSLAKMKRGRPGATPAGPSAGEARRTPTPPWISPTLSSRTVLTPAPMSIQTHDELVATP